jgi:hypothetical protein
MQRGQEFVPSETTSPMVKCSVAFVLANKPILPERGHAATSSRVRSGVIPRVVPKPVLGLREP